MWDLCCDHGILGLEALLAGQVPFVHFVDSSKNSRLHILEPDRWEHLSQRWRYIVADARTLAAEMSGTVAIAGVGGLLSVSILRAIFDSPARSRVRRMLVNPFCDEHEVADFLQSQGDSLATGFREMQILERGRTRRIFVVNL